MAWLYSDQWAAGFFDGEGCVSIFHRQRQNCLEYRVVVQLAQNDVRPLEEVRARFGGTISVNPANPRCSRWRVDGKNAEAFLRSIQPYALVKRRKIDLALEMRAVTGTPGHRVPDEWRSERARIEALFNA